LAQQLPERATCALAELSAAERARHGELLSRVQSLAEQVAELPDGYSAYLPAAEAGTVLEWIALERRCCSFLSFAIEFEAGEERAWLRVTGPDSAKDIMAALLGERIFESAGCCGGKGSCSC
jgi:hypothetical protein